MIYWICPNPIQPPPPHTDSLTFISTRVSILSSCSACSVVSPALSVRLLIPYSHTACARASKSTHQEEAVLSFAPIVPISLFSFASADHTAFARFSGDSSVNGVISPVIYPIADISASAVRVMFDSQVENATAQRVPVAHNTISEVPVPYKAPTDCPVRVSTILQIPVEDTTSDKSAFAVSCIKLSPSPFTHITAVPFPVRFISEKATTYPDFLGSIQPVLYHTGSPH